MRQTNTQTKFAAIPNGTALSQALNFHGFEHGMFHMPAAWTAASIGFQVSSTLGGTYQPLNDAVGAVVEVTSIVDESYPLPNDLDGARYFKLWSQTAGADVNQGAARTINVDLK